MFWLLIASAYASTLLVLYRSEYIMYFEDYIAAVTHSYSNVTRVAHSERNKPNPDDVAQRYAGEHVLAVDVWSLAYFATLVRLALDADSLWLFMSEQASRRDVVAQALEFVRRYPRLRFLHYSSANADLLLQAGVSDWQHHIWLPLINCRPVDFISFWSVNKTTDVCFSGRMTPRRRALLDVIAEFATVTVIDSWGSERNELVARHRIMINVHADRQFRVLESLRCSPAALVHTLVVSEISEPQHVSFIEASFVTVPYERLAETVRYILANYELFHAQQSIRPFDVRRVEHCRPGFVFR